jgi:hypothetical protein
MSICRVASSKRAARAQDRDRLQGSASEHLASAIVMAKLTQSQQ